MKNRLLDRRPGARNVTMLGLAAATMLIGLGCASSGAGYHQHVMRGRIVEASGGEIVLCIGSADRATAGQELSVYRLKGGRGSRTPTFDRVHEGRVRIIEIYNGHFARAEVIDGSARAHWIVDLEPRHRLGERTS